MNNYFKSTIDFLAYFTVYVVVPTSEVFHYLKSTNTLVLAFFLILFANMLYECYTRHSADLDQVVKKCIFVIGVVSTLLFFYSLFLVIYSNEGYEVLSLMRWPFALVLIPLAIIIWHGVNRAIYDIVIKKKV